MLSTIYEQVSKLPGSFTRSLPLQIQLSRADPPFRPLSLRSLIPLNERGRGGRDLIDLSRIRIRMPCEFRASGQTVISCCASGLSINGSSHVHMIILLSQSLWHLIRTIPAFPNNAVYSFCNTLIFNDLRELSACRHCPQSILGRKIMR